MEKFDIYMYEWEYEETLLSDKKDKVSKIRPVLVLDDGIFVPIVKISSKNKGYEIVDLQQSGLPKKSYILFDKIRLASRSSLLDKVGHLSDQDIQNIKYKGLIKESFDKIEGTFILNEDSRHQLIHQAQQGANYKLDRSKGKNRFARRVHSQISHSTREYNQIDMNKLFKSNILDVSIKVHGETDDYLVRISFGQLLDEINRKLGHRPMELRTVLRALMDSFNHNNVYISCSCPDWKYRMSYVSLQKNQSSKSAKDWISQNDPLPATQAPNITNPNDDLGSCCKHAALVLNNASWVIKVASVVNNYVNYMKDHEQYAKLYQGVIYPKIYGEPFDENNRLDEVGIEEPKIDVTEPTPDEVEPEEQPAKKSKRARERDTKQVGRDMQKYRNVDLDSSEDDINAANEYGRTRTQFKQGNKQGVRFAKKKPDILNQDEYDGNVGAMLR